MPDDVVIEFTVQGESRPAGSKTAYPVFDRATGQPRRTAKGRIITNVTHSKTKTKEPTKDYMERAANQAREAYHGELLNEPLELTLVFYRPHPQGHYGTGRNAGKLKSSIPAFPERMPDSLKTARAVEDALKGVVWTDDARVCHHDVWKRWGTHYYVEVRITTLRNRKPSETEVKLF